jgi:type II secretory pathway component PulM
VSEWLSRMRAWFDSLARREKLLVASAVGATALALLFAVVVQPLIGARSAAKDRAEAAQQQYEAVRSVKTRFDEMSGRLSAVEQKIATGPQGNLLATLQDLASRSAVKLDSIEPRTAPGAPPYRETKLQVTLENTSLPQVVRFLYEIENAPQVMSVKSLRLRMRPDQPGMLEVTFTVSSFERV